MFFEICSKIESHFDNVIKDKPFFDYLDGDMKQEYSVNGKKIIVNNDSQVGALYIDSEIDLKEITFANNKPQKEYDLPNRKAIELYKKLPDDKLDTLLQDQMNKIKNNKK